jgi:hypothetical protein
MHSRPEDHYIPKIDQLGRIIDLSEEALEADHKTKHLVISSVKEDFINRHLVGKSVHDVEKLPVNISVKYNIPLSIAEEVTGSIVADPPVDECYPDIIMKINNTI